MTDRKSLANCEKVETEKSENVRTCSRKGILLVPKPSTDPRDPLVRTASLCPINRSSFYERIVWFEACLKLR